MLMSSMATFFVLSLQPLLSTLFLLLPSFLSFLVILFNNIYPIPHISTTATHFPPFSL
jgi:hypothetical protein